MRIELKTIKVRELFEKYVNNENGVKGYKGRLNIRPAFQREFVYKDKQRDAVINTVRKTFPLNVMYWSVSGVDEQGNVTYELIDGQQRSISICQYCNGDFSIDYKYFFNLTEADKEALLDYELQVYVCEGTEAEKLDWFKTINIAGEKLTDQELRNAIYSGYWLTECKRYFSKTGCAAYNRAKDYINGNCIRQDYLETVLSWISHRDNLREIEEYMSIHQHDTNNNDIKLYFCAVMEWVQTVFPVYRKEMKGLDWGILYNKYHTKQLDPTSLEADIGNLLDDDDVQNNKGIYEYLLSDRTVSDEKFLNIRTFSDKVARKVYDRQGGICPMCGGDKHYEINEMEADHVIPWHEGGKTVEANCQMLCKHHNRTKSGR